MNAQTFKVTVEVAAYNTAQARARLEAAGFAVARVTAPKASPLVAVDPTARPDSRTDRPAGLDYLETVAYLRGYAKSCMAYARKHGIPKGDDLRAATVTYERDRHPAAHQTGLRELAKEHVRRAAYNAARRTERALAS